MSGIGGAIAGNLPGSTAGGGITGPQSAYAHWQAMQQGLGNAATFGSAGMGHGTGVTMADAGAMLQEALAFQGMSQADANAQAAYNAMQSKQLAGLLGGLGGLLGGFSSGGSLSG